MTKVILQPTGNRDAWKHYLDTIENDISIDEISPFLNSNQISDLKTIYPTDKVKIWGVTAGINGVNYKKWERIERGDVTLFSRDKLIYASAITTYKLVNEELAIDLWGVKDDGQTWEYIYFVDKVNEFKLPVRKFNEIVGYKLNNNIQGFNVLDDEKSRRILSNLYINAKDYSESIQSPERSPFKLVEDDEEGERVVTEGKKREGQEKFKQDLLDAYGKCAISREQTVDVLDACHIQEYKSSKSNHIQNGLLLRVDLHRLYDIGLIKIDENYRVWVDGTIKSKFYNSYHGNKLHLPDNEFEWPSIDAIKYHNRKVDT